jgi:hypothetical protein
MALLDVLDAVNIPEDEALQSFEKELATQPTEVPEETKPTTTTEKPEDKPKTTQSTTTEKPSIWQQYNDAKGTPRTGSATVHTQGTSASYGRSQTQGVSEGQTTNTQRTERVEPNISMEDWKKKYQYKDWSEFSKEMGYNPPSEKDLAERQKTQRQVAWIKGLGGIANEFAKMIGVSAGGDAAKQEYKIDEVDKYAKEKEDYIKKLEEYKTKGMTYELGLRDKYAQYMQNMAATVSAGQGTSKQTSEQEGESMNIGETDNKQWGYASRPTPRQTTTTTTTTKPFPNPYGTDPTTGKTKVFEFNYDANKDNATTNGAFVYIKENASDILNKNEMDEYNSIIDKTTRNGATENETQPARYQAVVYVTSKLLQHKDELTEQLIQEQQKLEKLKEQGAVYTIGAQAAKVNSIIDKIDKLEDQFNNLNATGVNIQLYEK